MPSVSMSGIGQNSASWTISGLGNPFTVQYYQLAYIVCSWSGGSQTSPPDYPASSGGTTSTSASGSVSGLPAGTFITVQAWARAANGQDYDAGTTSFTTAPPPNPRPSNFNWTNSKSSGGTFNLTAAEWNAFANRVNQFRAYKGLSTYGFTGAISGGDFAYWIYNQGVNAIAPMNPSYPLPPIQGQSGGIVYAIYLNMLRDSLNSIT